MVIFHHGDFTFKKKSSRVEIFGSAGDVLSESSQENGRCSVNYMAGPRAKMLDAAVRATSRLKKRPEIRQYPILGSYNIWRYHGDIMGIYWIIYRTL